jgi:hypothetical protein
MTGQISQMSVVKFLPIGHNHMKKLAKLLVANI